MIKGIHTVTIRRAGKPDRHYVYAWRGGPRIMTQLGGGKPKLDAEAVRRYHQAVSAASSKSAKEEVLLDLSAAWRRSKHWNELARSTKRTWEFALDRIEEKWGEVPLRLWSDPRMKHKIVDWRDEAEDTPRAADIRITVLRTMLEWGRERGKVSINAAAGVKTIWKGGNRAQIVWTDEDIAAMEEVAPQQVLDGLHLAALTGMRRDDLINLNWSEIGEVAIKRQARKKSGGQRQWITVPILPELRSLLEELRTRHRAEGVDTVLVNSHGRPWTGGGFTHAFNSARNKANNGNGIFHKACDEDEEDRAKHLHDVRGTFATKLMTTGRLSNNEVADVMGWSIEHVRSIRKAYVDDMSVVVSVAERMAREM